MHLNSFKYCPWYLFTTSPLNVHITIFLYLQTYRSKTKLKCFAYNFAFLPVFSNLITYLFSPLGSSSILPLSHSIPRYLTSAPSSSPFQRIQQFSSFFYIPTTSFFLLFCLLTFCTFLSSDRCWNLWIHPPHLLNFLSFFSPISSFLLHPGKFLEVTFQTTGLLLSCFQAVIGPLAMFFILIIGMFISKISKWVFHKCLSLFCKHVFLFYKGKDIYQPEDIKYFPLKAYFRLFYYLYFLRGKSLY